MDAWAVDADSLWVRRTAMLAQLRHARATDTDLLERVLVANLDDTAYGREFFVRKALGWALRQHARTDPAWVRTFVADPRRSAERAVTPRGAQAPGLLAQTGTSSHRAHGVAGQDRAGHRGVGAQRVGHGDGAGLEGQLAGPVGQPAGREEERRDRDVALALGAEARGRPRRWPAERPRRRRR